LVPISSGQNTPSTDTASRNTLRPTNRRHPAHRTAPGNTKDVPGAATTHHHHPSGYGTQATSVLQGTDQRPQHVSVPCHLCGQGRTDRKRKETSIHWASEPTGSVKKQASTGRAQPISHRHLTHPSSLLPTQRATTRDRNEGKKARP
jgi:hypothetical protein